MTARAVSDQSGAYRLVNLPPGVYQLRAELDGFNSVEQRDVKVGIDRTVTLEITMTGAFAGELTVLGEAPVVDTTNATTGVSVSSETFDRLPLARDFYAVAQIVVPPQLSERERELFSSLKEGSSFDPRRHFAEGK